MSFKSALGGFFSKVGSLVKAALGQAVANGLTDDILNLAKEWVKVAAGKAISDAQKREFVVQILTNKGVPESIARIAVELAYQLLKKELKKL